MSGKQHTTMPVLVLLLCVTASVGGLQVTSPGVVEDCLLGHQFYHPASARCWALLQQGPCTPGHWLVTSSQEDSTGVAECRPRLGGG